MPYAPVIHYLLYPVWELAAQYKQISAALVLVVSCVQYFLIGQGYVSEPAAMMYSSPQQATPAEPRLAHHYWIIAAGQEVVEE